MDKFQALEPTRLYASASTANNLFSRGSSKPAPAYKPKPQIVGRLPQDLHLLILYQLDIPDFPAYSRCSRATSLIARDDKVWERRWKALGVDTFELGEILDALEARERGQLAMNRAAAPPTIAVESMDDDFGDFTSVSMHSPGPDEMGDFVGAFKGIAVAPSAPILPAKPTFRQKYTRAHHLLKPFASTLRQSPHAVLSSLESLVSASPSRQAKTLNLLAFFLSPSIKPLRAWQALYSSLRSAMDRFDANLLTTFDNADGLSQERTMKDAAEASWQVWDRMGDWEMGKVWAEKREIFYEQGKWDPLANFNSAGELDFDAMDEFMGSIIGAIIEHGSTAVRVFPPAAKVLIAFADRLAVDVVGEYIAPLLSKARFMSNAVFLKASAATFRESWRMVDAIMQASREREDSMVTRTQAEDVVYQMFEVHMDDYLDEEVESLKQSFTTIHRDWNSRQTPTTSTTSAQFLGSHNPAQVKRNVLASFTSVLLLPVTIVPRAVGAVGGAVVAGGSAAYNGISMLNPQKWGATPVPPTGYSRNFGNGNGLSEKDADTRSVARSSQSSFATIDTPPTPASLTTTNQLELLLSLEFALELIHADREALKRVETFAGYPGHYGHRVRDTIEEVFMLLLQAISEKHITPGFATATEQMLSYKPADHEATAAVAPLLQFFELVHIGDTMQSMIQVYFDKDLAPHIDRTDFLNIVVREKKRFENTLDDSVAGGLNAGTEVLMGQVEHIIITLTKPREYYPPEGTPMDLGPTQGCTEAIKCLDSHCKLLKGSTSKEVLEVFYQEVGIRLIAILQKHIKRQIISQQGGFQIIADLNTYFTFISSLKVPSITADFSHLKMLGHVYVVEDAKDLAQIVKDVTRYGGAYRPEDIYEFIQRRSDWKKIEKIVDKTMYNLSFKEDCIIC